MTNPTTPKTKPTNIPWLGDIPADWEVRRLKDICFPNREKLQEKYETDFNIKYIEIENIQDGVIVKEPLEISFKESPSRARRVCKKGDILISTVRTYLKAIAQIKSEDENLICSTGFTVLTPNNEIMNSDYLFYSVFNDYFVETVCSLSDGVSYPAINEPVLSRIKILLPPLATQHAIVDFLDIKTTKIDETIATIEKEVELVLEYKKSLIYNVVTGKMVVL